MAVQNQIEIDITDVLLEVPIEVSIGRRRFRIYPLSLGKSFVVERLLDRIGLSRLGDNRLNNFLLLAAIGAHRDDFLKLIAYYTLPGDECLDTVKVERRIKELRKVKNHQIAALTSIALSSERTPEIMEHFRFEEESKRYDKVSRVKKSDGNNVMFGGRTVWGCVIDFLAQRYGWTLQYILWGISCSNLSLLMKDYVRTVYLTDDELKEAGLPKDNIFIKADDNAALDDFISTQNWR